jgi:hypothetical protein
MRADILEQRTSTGTQFIGVSERAQNRRREAFGIQSAPGEPVEVMYTYANGAAAFRDGARQQGFKIRG